MSEPILVVDDDEIILQSIDAILRDENYSVVVAANGKDALEQARLTPPALILLDMKMPIMDGYEATRLLRRMPQGRDLPVIAMTANAMKGDREKALAAGMNDHIAKPIVIDDMFATLARWVRPARRVGRG